MLAIMNEAELQDKEVIIENNEPDFCEKAFSSFTVNYESNDSDLNLDKAFDLVFEEVIKKMRNRTID